MHKSFKRNFASYILEHAKHKMIHDFIMIWYNTIGLLWF